MPWRPENKMKLRREIVELAAAEGANMNQVCLRYGISRSTGYKWLKRWESVERGGAIGTIASTEKKLPLKKPGLHPL